MKRVGIIGGGASGLLCAIALKQRLKDHIEVVILEKQSRVGKKILTTGNGRCNLSNEDVNPSHYNTELITEALQQFDSKACRLFFSEMGLLTRDENQRIYPYSEKATAVLDVLLHQLDHLNISVITDFEVSNIKATDIFSVYTKDYRLLAFDVIVMATGGVAGVPYDYLGYQICHYLGHHLEPIRPGLVALKTKESLKALSGIRLKAEVSLITKTKHETVIGEVLFKDDGLSGIALMDLSRFFEKNAIISMNLIYDQDIHTIKTFLEKQGIEEGLKGIVPKMIAQDILKRHITPNIKGVIDTLTHYTFTVIDTYGYNQAQITLGGISMKEIDPISFESLQTKNLYIIGELLDVDGACGGFNLHFAWASGYLAAQAIASKIEKEMEDL